MATKTKLTEGELFDPSTKTGWKLIPEQGWQYFDKGIVKTPGTTAKNTLKRVTGTIYEGGKTAVKYVDQFIEQDKKLRKKQRQSKIQEYKDFGKAVSEFDVEKEIKEEGGRVLKNLGNAFADIPKKFLTEPLESVTGSGVFQDGKELTVKQYKDSMTRARVAATENDSNSVSYGSDVELGVENDIAEYYNYKGPEPNTDVGQFIGSFDVTADPISSFSKVLADQSLFNLKDNSALGPTFNYATSYAAKNKTPTPTEKFVKSVVEPESPTDLTDSQAEAQETYGDASKGLQDNQVREWNTDMDVDDPGTITTIDPNREGYIGGKKQSAIQTKLLDSGFNKEQLSQLMQDHADWKADRKIDLGTSESATKAIEGGANIFMKIQDLLRGGK